VRSIRVSSSRAAIASPSLCQPLAQKDAPVPARAFTIEVFQHAEWLVADTAIKPFGVAARRVQPDAMTTARARDGFALNDQTRTDAAPARCFSHPEHLHQQPAIRRGAHQA